MYEDEIPHRRCEECKQDFNSSFELIDHLLDEDDDFNPYYVLPNGFKLMLGSLLRLLHGNADNPAQIELLTESTYVTLFASEMGYDLVDELVEDMVVNSVMQDIDQALEDLLTKGIDDDKGGA